MIEGGGLGAFKPEQIGPSDVQSRNGVIDIAGEGRSRRPSLPRAATSSYFQGPLAHWDCADQRALRHAVPENRLRVYDMRAAIEAAWPTPARCWSCAPASAPAWSRRWPASRAAPIGLIANNPHAPGRRHRRRRRRQGGALHAAVQCAWPADRLADRHAGLHGRARDRGAGPGAPRLPHVRGGGPPARCRSSPWCCARATAWARRP